MFVCLFIFTSKVGLFRNRRGITIQEKKATVKHRQVLETKERNTFVEERGEGSWEGPL